MILLAGNVAPSSGGIERTLEHIVPALTEAGKEVGILTFEGEDPPPGARAVPVDVRWGRGIGVFLNPFRLRRAVVAAVRRVEGEVEQLWARNAVVAGIVAGAFPSLPLVFIPPGTLRSVLPWERRNRSGGTARRALRNVLWRLWLEPLSLAREKQALRRAVVVVFSENMRRMISDDCGEAVARRVAVVPPGVDAARFRPASGEGAAHPAGVAFLGRLEERKGADLLLESMLHLPGEELLVIGEGSLLDGLRARAEALGARATFVGRVDEPAGILSRASVLAVPSLMEPFGHVMLEGLAVGLPVVGFSRASGARTAVEDVVEDGVNGVLVHERSPEALARGLARGLALAEEPGVRSRCRRDVLRRYRWDRFVTRVLALGAGEPQG